MPQSAPQSAPLAMRVESGTIKLAGVVLECSIGIHPHERSRRQRVRFDIDIETAPPPEIDNIAHVLDYDLVLVALRDLVQSRHFDLQETLCSAAAQLCLGWKQAKRVRVRTSKSRIYSDCEVVSFEFCASRREK